MSEPPAISVIIPLYNSARTIDETLDSLAAQSFKDWRAIIVNDGSTDEGPDLAARRAAADPRLSIIHQPNRGLAGARNAGLQRANGRYIAFLDADDWLLPHAFETLIATAEESMRGAAFGGYEWRDDSGRSLHFKCHESCPEAGLDQFLEFNRFPVHAQLIRRRTLGDLRFGEHLPVVEDYDLWLRLACSGVRWTAAGSIVSAYRVRPASLSKDFSAMFCHTRTILADAFATARRTAARGDSINLSTARFDRTVRRFALEHATALSWADPTPQKKAAIELLQQAPTPLHISPALAGTVAYFSLPFAACRAPEQWLEHASEFAAALEPFWRKICEEGWADDDFIELARAQLAAWMVSPDAIARTIADQVGDHRRIVLLGLGQNARRLAPHLAGRDLDIFARDDALSTVADPPGLAQLPLRLLPGNAPYDPAALHIMTPSEDHGWCRRLPSELPLLRWTRIRDRLARQMEEALKNAWPGSVGRTSPSLVRAAR